MYSTIQNDARRYCHKLAYGAPNGWGQYLIDGNASHWFLLGMTRRYGKEAVAAEVDLQFATMRALESGRIK